MSNILSFVSIMNLVITSSNALLMLNKFDSQRRDELDGMEGRNISQRFQIQDFPPTIEKNNNSKFDSICGPMLELLTIP